MRREIHEALRDAQAFFTSAECGAYALCLGFMALLWTAAFWLLGPGH